MQAQRFIRCHCRRQDGIKRVVRNLVSVEFARPHDTNVFLLNALLPSQKLVASIPLFHITRLGVISGIPSDTSEEDICIGICNCITVPPGCDKTLMTYRKINRKTFRWNFRMEAHGYLRSYFWWSRSSKKSFLLLHLTPLSHTALNYCHISMSEIYIYIHI